MTSHVFLDNGNGFSVHNGTHRIKPGPLQQYGGIAGRGRDTGLVSLNKLKKANDNKDVAIL